MQASKAVAIMVCYYPDYKAKSKEVICRLMQSLYSDYQLVIVNNNKDMSIGDRHGNTLEIRGSNRGGEFSAWDEGYRYVLENIKMKSDDVVIFANDTFCHHSPFTWLNKMIFKYYLSRLSQNQILGDLHKGKEDFKFENIEFESWISTYIFALRWRTVNKIKPLDKVNEIDGLAQKITLSSKSVTVKGGSVSLNSHLTNWLFSSDKNSGWYNASNADLALKQFKLNAIMNEKLLAAYAREQEIELIPTRGNFVLKIINRFQRKLLLAGQ